MSKFTTNFTFTSDVMDLGHWITGFLYTLEILGIWVEMILTSNTLAIFGKVLGLSFTNFLNTFLLQVISIEKFRTVFTISSLIMDLCRFIARVLNTSSTLLIWTEELITGLALATRAQNLSDRLTCVKYAFSHLIIWI